MLLPCNRGICFLDSGFLLTPTLLLSLRDLKGHALPAMFSWLQIRSSRHIRTIRLLVVRLRVVFSDCR